MKKNYFMGLDFGTQGVRCGIADEQGALVAVCEREYATNFPSSGFAEQNADDWILEMEHAVLGCKLQAGGEIFSYVRGIAVCSTSSTVLPVDKNHRPLTKAMLWMDVRAVEQAQKINNTAHEALRYCGGEDSVEWFGPKMMWLKDNMPEIYEKAARIVEQQDYINHYLTNRWCASVSQATCKSNFVEALGGYDPGFFNEIGLNDFFEKANLDVIKQAEAVGTIRREVADHLGLRCTTIIYQGGIDAHVNMIGLGVCKPGVTGIVMGSSFVHLAITDKSVFQAGVWGPYKDAIIPDRYCVEGGQISAGSITKWFLHEFNITEASPYQTMADEAASIPIGSEGVVVVDYFQGNRTPYKDPLAKGVIYGLTLSHKRAHIYRAILEAVAFGTRNTLETIAKGGTPISEIRGCGGVTLNPVWLQIIADVIGKPIALTRESGNAGVLGCAIIAAVGSGSYGSFVHACDHMVQITEVITPVTEAHEKYKQCYKNYLTIYQNLKQLMHTNRTVE